MGERVHHEPDRTLTWDVFGYYLYLPSLFIYQDLGMEKEEVYEGLMDEYEPSSTFYQVTENEEGDKVMRYPLGWALLYAPFFFLGHSIALLTSFQADGLSPPYQYAIGYGSLLFSLGGLFAFRSFLLRFFDDRISSLLLVLVALGTNFLHMTSKESALTHNHLFALFALFCICTLQWHRRPSSRTAFGIGLIGGLMIISRPSTILVFLVPLLWDVSSWRSFVEKLRALFAERAHHLWLLILGTALPGLLQMIYWKLYAGSFIFYSYQDPSVGFDLLSPYTFEFLFSFRKGWFIYTPLAALFLLGFFFYPKRDPKWKGCLAPILVYFIAHLYLTSSWTCWWYAGADYSQRAMLETYVLLALPMGWLLERMRRLDRKWSLIGAIPLGLLVLINLFHTWQFHQGIIHPTRMTMAYYSKIAGKTYKKEAWDEKLLVERSFTEEEKIPEELRSKGEPIATFEPKEAIEDPEKLRKDEEGNACFLLDETTEFSPSIEMPFHSITDSSYAWLSIHADLIPQERIRGPVHLVVTFKYRGKSYKYRTETVTEAERGEALHISRDYMTPHVREERDRLKTYIWNPEGQKVLLKELKVLKHNH